MELELLSRLQVAMHDDDVAAMVVTPGADLQYIAGYDAKPLERLTALVIPRDGSPVLVAPALEAGEARESTFARSGGDVITWTETQDPFLIVADLVYDGASGAIAVDDHMWAQRVLRLRQVINDRPQVLAGSILNDLRQQKTSSEIERLQEAAAAIESVHRLIPSIVRPGMTESAVAHRISAAIIDAGHTGVDFVIVASGPNGANPHHSVSERVIGVGDPIVIDIGGTMPGGYRSDCTRTYVIGEASADYSAAFEVLRHAQESSVAFVNGQRTCESIDAHARGLMHDHHLDGRPLDDYFMHRIGHGIGLESHEEPYLVEGNTDLLKPGMAFSIEPGFYVPGRFGARIEDIVVCTEDGRRNLNTLSRDLMRIPA